MNDTFHILAREEDAIKLVIGLVVGAIWLISAIVNAAKAKKPQGEQKPWEQVLRDLGAGTPPAPPPPVPQHQQRQQRPPPMPKKQQQPQQPKRKKQKQQQQSARPQPVAKPSVQFEESSTHRVVEEEAPPSSVTAIVSSTSSRAVPPTVSLGKTSMMLTPTTIREAMILTEVLGKPVSMRE
jgi:outer membrane biosynthesis protein TonB